MAMLAPSSVPALRAAIYVRVSSVGQEQDGTSLETQEQHCRAYAAEHGYTVVDVYREVYSGVELWERPQLTRLRDTVRRHEIGAVVCYAIDRLSRDPVHLGVILTEADHAGAVVAFVSEPIDDSPEGQLIRFVRGYAAKVEHLKIVERIRRGKLARVQSGKPLHGPRPLYGYRWRDTAKTGYEIDPITAPIVQRVFAAAVGGAPLRHIALGLTQDNIPTPSGASAAWNTAAIAGILHNPTYAGRPTAYRMRVEKRNGRRRVLERGAEETVALPVTVAPPLVDEAAFDAAESILTRNKAQASRNNQHPELYLLRGGYAVCGSCGGALRARGLERNGTGGYRCGTPTRVSGMCAAPVYINSADLDTAAWQIVESFVMRPEVIGAELARLQHDDPTQDDLAAIDRALVDVTRKQTNLARVAATLDDPDASAPLARDLAALAAHKRQLETEREAVLGRRAGWEAAQQQIDDLVAWCGTVATNLADLTYEQKRMALEALGVQARAWRTATGPQWEITTAIDLPEEGDDVVSSTIAGTSALATWSRRR